MISSPSDLRFLSKYILLGKQNTYMYENEQTQMYQLFFTPLKYCLKKSNVLPFLLSDFLCRSQRLLMNIYFITTETMHFFAQK